jgi:hypothetical protein
MIFRKDKKKPEKEVCFFCTNEAEFNEIADKSKSPVFHDFQYVGVCRKHMTNHYIA